MFFARVGEDFPGGFGFGEVVFGVFSGEEWDLFAARWSLHAALGEEAAEGEEGEDGSRENRHGVFGLVDFLGWVKGFNRWRTSRG